MPAFNAERASATLVEAAFRGDKRAAKKYGITERSIQMWRRRLDTDGAFFVIFRTSYKAALAGWATELSTARVATIRFLLEAAQTGDPRDPQMVEAITGSFKALVDADFAREILNARVNQQRGAPAEDAGPLAAADRPDEDGGQLEGSAPSPDTGGEGGGAV